MDWVFYRTLHTIAQLCGGCDMTDTPLKPCPFCGAEAAVAKYSKKDGTRHVAVWASCQCSDYSVRFDPPICESITEQMCVDDVVKHWNTRPALQPDGVGEGVDLHHYENGKHADITDRLRGKVKVPINDGLGHVEGQDGFFERSFPSSVAANEAADYICSLREKIVDLEEYICKLVYRVTDGRMSKGYDIDVVAAEVEDICTEICAKENEAITKPSADNEINVGADAGRKVDQADTAIKSCDQHTGALQKPSEAYRDPEQPEWFNDISHKEKVVDAINQVTCEAGAADADPVLLEVLNFIELCRSLKITTGGGGLVDAKCERVELADKADALYKKLEAMKWGLLRTPDKSFEEIKASGELSDLPALVSVPKSALDWLFGSGPDTNGQWFHETQDDEETYNATFKRKTGQYWWRKHFRKLIEAHEKEACAHQYGPRERTGFKGEWSEICHKCGHQNFFDQDYS